jgi:hypothetical protein
MCYSFCNNVWGFQLVLKGFKPCGKNLVNSLKLYLDLTFTTVNLVSHTCMQDYEILYKCQKGLVWK